MHFNETFSYHRRLLERPVEILVYSVNYNLVDLQDKAAQYTLDTPLRELIQKCQALCHSQTYDDLFSTLVSTLVSASFNPLSSLVFEMLYRSEWSRLRKVKKLEDIRDNAPWHFYGRVPEEEKPYKEVWDIFVEAVQSTLRRSASKESTRTKFEFTEALAFHSHILGFRLPGFEALIESWKAQFEVPSFPELMVETKR